MSKLIVPFFKQILSTNKDLHKQIFKISGYYPKNEELYKLAFIHRSASLRLPNGKTVNNERLEFLGDAVLDAVIGEYLYRNFPNEDEGFLTTTRSKIVNGVNLGKLATTLELDKLIVSHVSQYNTNKHILADAFEAFVGALYLDREYKAVKKFVHKQIDCKNIDIDEILNTEHNYKSKLIEWSQKEKKEISFKTDDVNKELTNQEFSSVVIIDGKEMAQGKGYSKKEAEQQASERTLQRIL